MADRATTINTKRMLARSLRAAAAQKPLSKITVSEIVAASGVNRKTFYYHFRDVPELLEWVLADEAIDRVHAFELPREFDRAVDFSLRYVERNRAFLRNAYDALGQDKLRSLFYTDFQTLVGALVDERCGASGEAADPEYADFLVHFCTEGLAAQIIDWIHERSQHDRETLTRYLITTLERATDLRH